MRIITVIQLEKHIVQTCILYIIICKCSHWKEPCLIILFIIDINLKINLHKAVFSLSSVISLEIENSEESPINSQRMI